MSTGNAFVIGVLSLFFKAEFIFMPLFFRSFIIISIQRYLMFISCIHLEFFILKHHLLEGVTVIKHKAIGGYKVFLPLQYLSSNSLSTFLHAYILVVNTTNFAMNFQLISSFIILTSFLFFNIGKDLVSSIEYPVVSNLVFTSC